MLSARYTGQNDIIEISDGETTLSTSFHRLGHLLDPLSSIIPPPCSECEGTGEVVIEERDIAICGTCKGSRIS